MIKGETVLSGGKLPSVFAGDIRSDAVNHIAHVVPIKPDQACIFLLQCERYRLRSGLLICVVVEDPYDFVADSVIVLRIDNAVWITSSCSSAFSASRG